MIGEIPSYNPKKKRYIKRGFKALSQQQYTLAMADFTSALNLDSSDLEARIGILIADIALDFPKKAEVFCELYHLLLSNAPRSEKRQVQEQMIDILKSFDQNLNEMALIVGKEEELETEKIDGIKYRDFVAMCEKNGFKEVFENLMFSSKIIFTAQQDFFAFLKDLINNGFEHIALSYIEDMPNIGYNQRILDTIQSAINKKAKEKSKNLGANHAIDSDIDSSLDSSLNSSLDSPKTNLQRLMSKLKRKHNES